MAGVFFKSLTPLYLGLTLPLETADMERFKMS
jgi:hypothetical protein